MARAVGVDVEQLRVGAKALKGAVFGARPSADATDGFGSSVARGAVHRFEAYWVRGQSTVDEGVADLARALEKAADSYQQRDAQDAEEIRRNGEDSRAF